MTALSRRNWLKTAAGSALLAGASAARAQCTDPMPPQWDETFDVVVIGEDGPVFAAEKNGRDARRVPKSFGIRRANEDPDLGRRPAAGRGIRAACDLKK